jgi:formiminotetrahydrofolate cyclodeaminase
MQSSIWSATLAAFRDTVGGAEPVPAGVAISAVSASLALALLSKVLRITGSRKDFAGDPDQIERLYEAARRESIELARLADEDVRAFNHYLECLRQAEDEPGRDQAIAAAIRKAIEVPMNGARAAVRGLTLCVDAAGLVAGLTAADLGIAAGLLAGAAEAMLVSVDFNVHEMCTDEGFARATTTERHDLGLAAASAGAAVARLQPR